MSRTVGVGCEWATCLIGIALPWFSRLFFRGSDDDVWAGLSLNTSERFGACVFNVGGIY